jgi:hypothetical protein
MYRVCSAFQPCNGIDTQVLDDIPNRKGTKGEVDVPEAALELCGIEIRIVQKRNVATQCGRE